MHYHKSFSFWGRIMIIINKSLGLTLSRPHRAFWVINNFCSPLFYCSCCPPLWCSLYRNLCYYAFFKQTHFEVRCRDKERRWVPLLSWQALPPQIIENIQCVSFTQSDSVFIPTLQTQIQLYKKEWHHFDALSNVNPRPQVTLDVTRNWIKCF